MVMKAIKITPFLVPILEKNLMIVQNVNGLNESKVNDYVSMLSKHRNIYLVLLAETWFAQKSYVQKLPYYIGSSKESVKAVNASRPTEGLLLLAQPEYKCLISIISTSRYYIYFKFNDKNILFVYLPPSLAAVDISNILKHIVQKPHMLIGDLNIRLGKQNGDSKQSPLDRINVIKFFALDKWNLKWIGNKSSTISRLDHVHSTDDLVSGYTFHPSFVLSDHGIMVISLCNINSLYKDVSRLG